MILVALRSCTSQNMVFPPPAQESPEAAYYKADFWALSQIF